MAKKCVKPENFNEYLDSTSPIIKGWLKDLPTSQLVPSIRLLHSKLSMDDPVAADVFRTVVEDIFPEYITDIAFDPKEVDISTAPIGITQVPLSDFIDEVMNVQGINRDGKSTEEQDNIPETDDSRTAFAQIQTGEGGLDVFKSHFEGMINDTITATEYRT